MPVTMSGGRTRKKPKPHKLPDDSINFYYEYNTTVRTTCQTRILCQRTSPLVLGESEATPHQHHINRQQAKVSCPFTLRLSRQAASINQRVNNKTLVCAIGLGPNHTFLCSRTIAARWCASIPLMSFTAASFARVDGTILFGEKAPLCCFRLRRSCVQRPVATSGMSTTQPDWPPNRRMRLTSR